VNEENYSLGLFREYEIVYYNKMVDFKQSAEQNYKSVRDKFNLPSAMNFAVYVRTTLGQQMFNVTGKNPDMTGQILATDVPIQIVYQNGTFVYALMNLQIW